GITSRLAVATGRKKIALQVCPRSISEVAWISGGLAEQYEGIRLLPRLRKHAHRPHCSCCSRPHPYTREACQLRRLLSEVSCPAADTRTMDAQVPLHNGAAATANGAPRRLSVTITSRSLWLGAGLAVGILLAVLIVSKALSTLVLLLLAIILAEAIRPLVARM